MMQAVKDILDVVTVPEPMALDISRLPKGIDNYRIDIRLSNRFASDLAYLVQILLRREIEEDAGRGDKDGIFTPLRQSYQDLMAVLLHRAKTDLGQEEIRFLQFAVPAHVLHVVGEALDEYKTNLQHKAAELRSSGSGEILKLHNRLAWLNKHKKLIGYRIRRAILAQLHQIEQHRLKTLRRHHPDEAFPGYREFLDNPILAGGELHSALFLVENYLYWGGSIDQSDFPAINHGLENLLAGLFPEFEVKPLKTKTAVASAEVFDELHGLKALESVLGPSAAMGETLSESFCWLDLPENMEHLFDVDRFREDAPRVRREQGLKAWFAHRRQVKRLDKSLAKIAIWLKKEKLLNLLAASYETKKIWRSNLGGEIDPKLVCQYLAGQIDIRKVQNPALGGKALSDRESEILEASRREVGRAVSRPQEMVPTVLADLARFRRHLKYSRFAHRVFNRMNLLRRENDIRLSQEAGTLYSLFRSGEVKTQEEARTVHHTILKADVRGSTIVTETLERKELNAASYFSLHFFKPINEILPRFGASKVFIEGDAIILSFLEYEGRPHEWFSVSLACGLGRAILNIIRRNNLQARRTGLPELEFGIGISYSPEPPRFLYDGDHPIMITSAISVADRLSSSMRALREGLEKSPFNVGLYTAQDEGGQLAYNVNGISLEDRAFDKLRGEIHLQDFRVSIDGLPQIFHLGKHRDLEGRQLDILIREGRVGEFSNGVAHPGDESAERYYEVVVNEKLINEFAGKAGRLETASPEQT